MRRFGTDRIRGLMGKLGMDDETPIEHGIISKSIESAQTKVEGHNSDIRRHVVQYDDVMNRHREVIYADRGRIVAGDDMSDKMDELVTEELEAIVDRQSAREGRRDRLRDRRAGVQRALPARTGQQSAFMSTRLPDCREKT